MTEKEVLSSFYTSMPVLLFDKVYIEPIKIDEICNNMKHIKIPVYMLSNFDNGRKIYVAINNEKVAMSKYNISGLQCSVCEFSKEWDKKYYSCGLRPNAKDFKIKEYLKKRIKIEQLESTR